MRILVHEFVTGGGWYSIHPTELPPESLRREGEFMVRETCKSLACVPECDVVVMRDVRSPIWSELPGRTSLVPISSITELESSLQKLSQRSERVIIIAPETGGCLRRLCAAVDERQLLGPDSDFVNECSSKHGIAILLNHDNVPAPRGIRLLPGAALPTNFTYPAVLKPDDGCGSQGVRKIKGPNDPQLNAPWRIECGAAMLRLEEYIPGQAASVGVMMGTQQDLFLPPFFQWIDQERNFAYRGGAMIEDVGLVERAQRLAEYALAALPPALGYVGFDIIFGDAADGSQDHVIEVNPRFTTSFAALMGHVASPEYSLMGALIDLIEGRPAKIKWKEEPLRFSVDDFD